MSLIDSRIGRPKLNGKSLAQVSSTMFEKHNRDLVYLKDGVWTVITDKPRTTTSQFFTPHNSWDFLFNLAK